jgi:hypothetical protein
MKWNFRTKLLPLILNKKGMAKHLKRILLEEIIFNEKYTIKPL